MRTTAIIAREVAAHLARPLTGALVCGFLLLAGMFDVYSGAALPVGDDSVQAMFTVLPWLYVGLVPALSMRLWAGEQQTGTIELLLSLPVRPSQLVVGKFLAAWLVAGAALALTFPLWLTASLTGRPDNGAVAVGYAASWLLCGALLAVGEAVSAATRRPLSAFLATTAIAAALLAPTAGAVAPWQGRVPGWLLSVLSEAGASCHFTALTGGLVALPDVAYFLSLIVAPLAAAVILVDLRREM